MAIAVICPSCKSRFSVSDQFAGRTGPCPKCKKPIKIPAVTAEAVVIHEPEAQSQAPREGRDDEREYQRRQEEQAQQVEDDQVHRDSNSRIAKASPSRAS